MSKNVKFNYLYRDAGNYKSMGEVIFANPQSLSLEEIDVRLRKAFDQEFGFIADQIAVGEVFLYSGNGDLTADDHCFHEFESVEFTQNEPTDSLNRQIEDFVAQVEKESRAGWRAYDPAEKIR